MKLVLLTLLVCCALVMGRGLNGKALIAKQKRLHSAASASASTSTSTSLYHLTNCANGGPALVRVYNGGGINDQFSVAEERNGCAFLAATDTPLSTNAVYLCHCTGFPRCCDLTAAEFYAAVPATATTVTILGCHSQAFVLLLIALDAAAVAPKVWRGWAGLVFHSNARFWECTSYPATMDSGVVRTACNTNGRQSLINSGVAVPQGTTPTIGEIRQAAYYTTMLAPAKLLATTALDLVLDAAFLAAFNSVNANSVTAGNVNCGCALIPVADYFG